MDSDGSRRRIHIPAAARQRCVALTRQGIGVDTIGLTRKSNLEVASARSSWRRGAFVRVLIGTALIFATLMIGSMMLANRALNEANAYLQSSLARHADRAAIALRSSLSMDASERILAAVGAAGGTAVMFSPQGETMGSTNVPVGFAKELWNASVTKQALVVGAIDVRRTLHSLGGDAVLCVRRIGPESDVAGVLVVARRTHGFWSSGPSTVGLLSAIGASLVIVAWIESRRTRRSMRAGRRRRPSAPKSNGVGDFKGDGRSAMFPVLAQLRDGVVLIDDQHVVQWLNRSALRLLDLPDSHPDQLVGRLVEQVIPHHSLQQLLLHAPASATDSSVDQRAEIRISVESTRGTTHLLARTASVLMPAARGASRTLARILVLTDVTELTHVVQVKSDFVANASHELRTPLAAIRAAVETTRDASVQRDTPTLTRFLDIIERQSERLEQMAVDLLDLARAEGESSLGASQCVSLADVFREMEVAHRPSAERRGITLEVNAVDDDWTVDVDRRALVTLLDNLLQNAIRFTESGKRVGLRAFLEAGRFGIEVEDEGCGIAREDQARVFERFYQVQRERSGRDRGTGLGLSIVRHAARAMGATVSMESTLDVGTCVRVVFSVS